MADLFVSLCQDRDRDRDRDKGKDRDRDKVRGNFAVSPGTTVVVRAATINRFIMMKLHAIRVSIRTCMLVCRY